MCMYTMYNVVPSSVHLFLLLTARPRLLLLLLLGLGVVVDFVIQTRPVPRDLDLCVSSLAFTPEGGPGELGLGTDLDSKELNASNENSIVLAIQLFAVFTDKCTKVVVCQFVLVLNWGGEVSGTPPPTGNSLRAVTAPHCALRATRLCWVLHSRA